MHVPIQYLYCLLTAGHVYISGWKHDQIDLCAPCAKRASAKTKLYRCMDVAM